MRLLTDLPTKGYTTVNERFRCRSRLNSSGVRYPNELWGRARL